MEIYLLGRTDGSNVDEAVAFVVIAESERAARRLAADGAGDEGAYPWAFTATCDVIGKAETGQEPRVVIRNFNGC